MCRGVVTPLRSGADGGKVLEATAVTVAITRRAFRYSSSDSMNRPMRRNLSMIQADLETLKTLYQTLKDDVQRSDDIQKLTDTALQNAVWESTHPPPLNRPHKGPTVLPRRTQFSSLRTRVRKITLLRRIAEPKNEHIAFKSQRE